MSESVRNRALNTYFVSSHGDSVAAWLDSSSEARSYKSVRKTGSSTGARGSLAHLHILKDAPGEVDLN